ncbi:MAG: catalase [Pseudomonadota bacterium]
MPTTKSRTRSSSTAATNTNLAAYRVDDAGSSLTSNQGIPIPEDNNSLRAGVRGPTLAEDFHFLEKIQHFDHERIPERVVHARGVAAHGFFEATADIKDVCCAEFLKPGTMTPVFVRFSTVAGEKGSSDLARDVRGFATKFYTQQGVFDLVGNNIPVFFIQDAIKFPDLIHAVKPEPHNAIPQAASAHDTFWDFVSLSTETTHMLMWVMSDRALPRSLSMMEGFGVHTFRLINEEGAASLVKFHWKPKAGTHNLIWDEAVQVSGADPDFHRRDLWQLIEDGHYPEWELGLQIFTEADAAEWPFDVLDATKLIPEELCPVQIVGRMLLNRNPDNYFAETEQVAYSVGHLVPGIDLSEDPLLQGRVFSYQDTQLSRLGSPNFHELPINKSLSPVHSNQRDAHMRMTINQGRAAYSPNTVGGGCPMTGGKGFVHYPAPVSGVKQRIRSETFADHFSQATLFYSSQTPVEQAHIAKAFSFELGKVESVEIRERMIGNLAKVDAQLAATVGDALDIVPDTAKGAPAPDVQVSPTVTISKELSLMFRPGSNGIKGLKLAVLVAAGSDGKQVASAKAALTAEGATVKIIAVKLGTVSAKDGGSIAIDHTLATQPSIAFDAVIIPGGPLADTLAITRDAINFVHQMNCHLKTIIACKYAKPLLDAAKVAMGDAGVLPMADSKAGWQKIAAAIAKLKHYEREPT